MSSIGFVLRQGSSVVAFSAMLLLTSCADSWHAFVYPDKTNLKFSARLGPFKSLNECRANATERLVVFSKQTNPGVTGDYECGKNCDDGGKRDGVAICEETVR
jgi:hypothetical protein